VTLRRLAALIGSPVEHSLSPVIHQSAFDAAGVAWTYVAFDVAPGDAAAAVDRLDPAAAALQSVNTVSWDGEALIGSSTDGAGFVASLAEIGIAVAGVRVAVIGAGGAARSVVDALGRAGAGSIVVVNRTIDRAVLAASLAEVAMVGEVADVVTADIVVNATSIGMGVPARQAGAADLPCPVTSLHPEQVVVDLVYHPLRTAWLLGAEAVGARTVDGLGMLIHQAALQQQVWTGRHPDVRVMRSAAEAALASR
jgi:shikimate dehydrogenase